MSERTRVHRMDVWLSGSFEVCRLPPSCDYDEHRTAILLSEGSDKAIDEAIEALEETGNDGLADRLKQATAREGR